MSEYRINLSREVGYNPDRPRVSRRRMVSFADTIPSFRIAVDLKVELFRNASKPWTMNAIYDIDALSMAVPYCHVVVPDREMHNLLSRSGAGPRCGTKIITTLAELPDALPELAKQAQNAPGDQTGWDWAGQWDGYCLDWNDLRCSRSTVTLARSSAGRPPTSPGATSTRSRAHFLRPISPAYRSLHPAPLKAQSYNSGMTRTPRAWAAQREALAPRGYDNGHYRVGCHA